MQMSVEQTLAELVAIDSVSQRSNIKIVKYLEDRCATLGLQTKRFPYHDEFGVEKINLIALSGADFSQATPIELALVGHTDTVPFDPAWTNATTLTERDGNLYGRGACDTKAFIASMLTAAATTNLQQSLALIFTADEELGLFGAKHLAAEKVLQIRHAIVGEPTSLQPMRAGKGYCLAELTLKGREAHSAYPAVGASAIMRAAHLLTRIESISEKLKMETHDDFDPPYTTLNVGLIQGGTAKNVIPGECRLTLEWRPVPGQDPTLLLKLIAEAIADEKKTDADFSCDVDAGRTDNGFDTSSASDLVLFMQDITGKKAGTVAFGTEAPQMIELGADAVVFGPGDIRVAHRTDEFVPMAELNGCVEVLTKAIDRYCGTPL